MSREGEDRGEQVGHNRVFTGAPRAAQAGCLTSLCGIHLSEPPAGKWCLRFADREMEDGG